MRALFNELALDHHLRLSLSLNYGFRLVDVDNAFNTYAGVDGHVAGAIEQLFICQESSSTNCILSQCQFVKQTTEAVQQERSETRECHGVGQHRASAVLLYQDGDCSQEEVSTSRRLAS